MGRRRLPTRNCEERENDLMPNEIEEAIMQRRVVAPVDVSAKGPFVAGSWIITILDNRT